MSAHRRWGLARVHGDSMRPTLRPGDRVLVDYARTTQAGDVVLARFGDGTLAVKRVRDCVDRHDGSPGWFLTSDDPTVGVDSRHRGPVAADAVLGVVLCCLWPRPHRIR